MFVFDGERIDSDLLSVPRLPAVLTAVSVTDEAPGAPCLGTPESLYGESGGLEERRAKSLASGYESRTNAGQNAQELVCLLSD